MGMAAVALRWRGLLILLLGAATVAGTLVLDTCADAGHFATMASGMQAPMRCTWTERAVLGIGGLVMVIGLIMTAAHQAARLISAVAVASGVLLLVVPMWLIPTCANPAMPCNLSLKPGVLLVGGLITLGGLAGAVRVRRAEGAPELRQVESAR